VKYGDFSGFVSHYHISKNKIDCAGLDLRVLLEEAEQEDATGYVGSSNVCEDEV
jgi:hypothetical protein